MELSPEIKTLYKHWGKHTRIHHGLRTSQINTVVLNKIVIFINKRLEIYEKREKGVLPPYSSDPILNRYRFCNIYRELDRQTIYFHTLLKPQENNFPLWLLNMLFCRSICNTDTINQIGLLNFDHNNNQHVFNRLLTLKSPKYGTAYIFPISSIQKSKWNSREKFFCLYYPLIANNVSEMISSFNNTSVTSALKRVLPSFGFNLKFLITELLIDVSYQYPQYIDLFKSFPIGPGSTPTMRLLSPCENPETTNLQLSRMSSFHINYPTYKGREIFLSAENWEGIGCEFRKYTNLLAGKGRHRIFNAKIV
jgi:hypothetical protein